jgi:hypothetical protein
MLYAGLDLSRQRLDVHVLDEEGRTVEVTAATPDVFGLRELVARIARHGEEVSATIESMNGAHRAVSPRPPVGPPGRSRTARQERPQVPALGAHRPHAPVSRDRRQQRLGGRRR